MLEIRDYSDYRKFLMDLYQSRKAVNRNFSFRYLSHKAGINSSGFYKLILDGKRNLTTDTILKTCKAFSLNDLDSEYFEVLVQFNQARFMKQKNLLFDKLIDLQKHRKIHKIEEDRYDYFADWYHCVIRELAVITNFKDDYRVLANKVKPKITPSQAKASVKLLMQLGFLKQEGHKYLQSEPIVSTGIGIKSHIIKKFQIEILKKSIEVYDRQENELRIMSSNVLAFSQKNFERFAEKLRNFRVQVLGLANDETSPDIIYMMNLNLFPCSELVNTDNEKE